jgi:hypothetical protein
MAAISVANISMMMNIILSYHTDRATSRAWTVSSAKSWLLFYHPSRMERAACYHDSADQETFMLASGASSIVFAKSFYTGFMAMWWLGATKVAWQLAVLDGWDVLPATAVI